MSLLVKEINGAPDDGDNEVHPKAFIVLSVFEVHKGEDGICHGKHTKQYHKGD